MSPFYLRAYVFSLETCSFSIFGVISLVNLLHSVWSLLVWPPLFGNHCSSISVHTKVNFSLLNEEPYILWVLPKCLVIPGCVDRVFEIPYVPCAMLFVYRSGFRGWPRLDSGRELVLWRRGFYSSWVSPTGVVSLDCFREACPFGIFQAVTLPFALTHLFCSLDTLV